MAGNAIQPTLSDTELASHAASYHHFMLGVKWSIVVLGSFITFTTIWFATPAGFFWGLIVGALIFAIGVYAMGHGLAHSTESDNPPAG